MVSHLVYGVKNGKEIYNKLHELSKDIYLQSKIQYLTHYYIKGETSNNKSRNNLLLP